MGIEKKNSNEEGKKLINESGLRGKEKAQTLEPIFAIIRDIAGDKGNNYDPTFADELCASIEDIVAVDSAWGKDPLKDRDALINRIALEVNSQFLKKFIVRLDSMVFSQSYFRRAFQEKLISVSDAIRRSRLNPDLKLKVIGVIDGFSAEECASEIFDHSRSPRYEIRGVDLPQKIWAWIYLKTVENEGMFSTNEQNQLADVLLPE